MGVSSRKPLFVLLLIAVVSAVSAGADIEEDPLEFLRTSPQFQQLRDIIRDDPQQLKSVLQKIAHTNPAFIQVISEHQEEFLRLINEGASTSGPVVVGTAAAGGGPGQGFAALSTQDREAIERLKSEGFTEAQAVDAYIKCDRNEVDALNHLIQSMDNDE